MFFAISVIASCLLAAAVLLLVAVASGHIQLPENSRLTGIAKRVSAVLNAQTPPPRFLERLDEPRPAPRG